LLDYLEQALSGAGSITLLQAPGGFGKQRFDLIHGSD
jgi:hypothetical protein